MDGVGQAWALLGGGVGSSCDKCRVVEHPPSATSGVLPYLTKKPLLKDAQKGKIWIVCRVCINSNPAPRELPVFKFWLIFLPVFNGKIFWRVCFVFQKVLDRERLPGLLYRTQGLNPKPGPNCRRPTDNPTLSLIGQLSSKILNARQGKIF